MTEIRGTKENPFHLSLGMVILDDNEVVILKKSDGNFFLPCETIHTEESIEEALKRGSQEELGFEVQILHHLGSRQIIFSRDQITIEKTICYFLLKKIGEVQRTPEPDEIDDELLWYSLEEAINLFETRHNSEAEILKRIHVASQ